MRVSEIRVNQIRVNQGLGVLDVQGTFQKPIEPKITAFDSVLWHGSKFIRPE